MNNIFTTCDMHGHSVYEIVQAKPEFFYARFLQYVPYEPFTSEQLIDMAEADAEYAAMCEHFGHTPEEAALDAYRTPEAAKRAIELHDVIAGVPDDMRAFGAPSECHALAYAPLQRELDALEREFGVRQPTDPYREHYGYSRDATLGEVLGLPADADDHTIIRALGERSALA